MVWNDDLNKENQCSKQIFNNNENDCYIEKTQFVRDSVSSMTERDTALQDRTNQNKLSIKNNNFVSDFKQVSTNHNSDVNLNQKSLIRYLGKRILYKPDFKFKLWIQWWLART